MLILFILGIINVYLILNKVGLLEVRVNNSLAAVDKALSSLKQPEDGERGEKGEQGYTPVKGVDYKDGDKGNTGSTGVQGVQGIQGVPGIGEKGATGEQGATGADGRTPVMRCNESKNRWEVQYDGDTTWTVVRNENRQPAKCKATVL